MKRIPTKSDALIANVVNHWGSLWSYGKFVIKDDYIILAEIPLGNNPFKLDRENRAVLRENPLEARIIREGHPKYADLISSGGSVKIVDLHVNVYPPCHILIDKSWIYFTDGLKITSFSWAESKDLSLPKPIQV